MEKKTIIGIIGEQAGGKGSASDIIIKRYGGVRMKGDTDPFKKVYKESFTLIYVTADPKIRYERSKKRGEKAGENLATLEEFLEKEKAPTEAAIAEVGKTADFKITNDGNYEELEKAVIAVMEKI